jgi:arginase family enzyme
MDLFDLIDPVELEKPDDYFLSRKDLFSHKINIHTENFNLSELSQHDIIIIGAPEDRNSFNRGAALSPNRIRSELYKLIQPSDKFKILDIGNLKSGNTYSDTYFALKEVTTRFLGENLNIILIGGSQDLTLPVFQAFESYQKKINLVTVDSRIDANPDAIEVNSESYLLEILLKKKKLFKYANLGHQAYFTEKNSIELINKLFQDAIRLGEIRNDITMIEPVLRDADIISFDMGAVRHSDSPGYFKPMPNGFYAEEVCQIARYAGTSDMIRFFGIFESNAKLDTNNHTSALAAQMIWYYIDGISNRVIEYPDSNSSDYKTFIVTHHDLDHEMIFYKSMKTDRWWMEIPNIKENNQVVVACSHHDYQTACNHEVPDLWWKTYQKLS